MAKSNLSIGDLSVWTRGRLLWESAVIILVTGLVYLPAIHGGFIWNDRDYVTKPELRSWHGLWRIWFDLGATEQYYPLLHSAFWVEHGLWGAAAVGYHMVNILLHAAAACLFVVVLRRLSIPGAWLAGLIFALHPVCVESVAWIAEQKNTLSTAFYLLAMLAYLRWRKTAPDGRSAAPYYYLLATGLYLLALLSKTVTATLPAAIGVILWWQQGRLRWRKDIAPLVPWLAMGAIAGIFSSWVERRYVGAEGASYALSFTQRGLVAGRQVWFYLGKLLWPTNLIFIYPRWQVNAGVWWQYLFPLAVVVLAAALWLIRRRTRAPLAILLIFVGTLFPTSGFFNIYAFIYSFVADHWQYLASLGIITPAASGLTLALKSRSTSGSIPFRWGGVSVALLLSAMGVLTWRQCRMYSDMETFYRTTIDKNPGCWMAHNNLGLLLAAQGREQEAIDQFKASLRFKPDHANAHANLAAVLSLTGHFEEAKVHYGEALRLTPRSPMLQYNLGNAYSRARQWSEAIEHYKGALQIRPNDAGIHGNLAIALGHAGRFEEAMAHYQAALRLEPNAFGIHNNFANALARSGRVPEAIFQYEEALRLKPDFAPARAALERLQGRVGVAAPPP